VLAVLGLSVTVGPASAPKSALTLGSAPGSPTGTTGVSAAGMFSGGLTVATVGAGAPLAARVGVLPIC